MPTFIYVNNVPNPPDLPSQDVQSMQNNTAAIENIINVDHYGFGIQNGGFHKQVALKNEPSPPLIVGDGTADGILYANIVGGQSVPFWKNALIDVQLISGTVTPVSANNGFTDLPGGMILQWGTIVNTGLVNQTVLFATANINFPTNCFNVQLTPQFNAGIPVNTSLGVSSKSNTQFVATISATPPGLLGFFWWAIGN